MYFILQLWGHSPLLSDIRTAFKAGNRHQKDHCLLACFQIPQGQGAPTLITTEGNAPTNLPTGRDGGNSSMEVPSSQAALVCAKLTEKNENTFSVGLLVSRLLAFRI